MHTTLIYTHSYAHTHTVIYTLITLNQSSFVKADDADFHQAFTGKTLKAHIHTHTIMQYVIEVAERFVFCTNKCVCVCHRVRTRRHLICIRSACCCVRWRQVCSRAPTFLNSADIVKPSHQSIFETSCISALEHIRHLDPLLNMFITSSCSADYGMLVLNLFMTHTHTHWHTHTDIHTLAYTHTDPQTSTYTH